MTTNDIKTALGEIIKPICPTLFFGRGKAIYPKIEADIRQAGTDNSGIDTYALTLDLYSDEGILSPLDKLTDTIIATLRDTLSTTDSGMIWTTYDGSRALIPEQDNNKINHIAVRFTVNVFNSLEV